MRAERFLATLRTMSSRLKCTHPPLAVLLSINYNHLPLTESQLVRMVSRTVVDGLHSLWLLLLHRQSPERLADSRRGPPPDQGARAADGEEEGLTETVLLGLGVGGAGLCADLDPDPLKTTETETSPSAYSAFWGQRWWRCFQNLGEAPCWFTQGLLAGGLSGRWLSDLKAQRQGPFRGKMEPVSGPVETSRLLTLWLWLLEALVLWELVEAMVELW